MLPNATVSHPGAVSSAPDGVDGLDKSVLPTDFA